MPFRSLALVLCLAAVAPAQMLPPGAAPKPAPATAAAPTSQPEDVAAIRDTLAKYNAAVTAGDVATLQGFIATSSDTQKKALALMGKLTNAGRDVYQAAVTKFGEAELAKNQVERQSFPAGYPALPADAVDVVPNGDKASLVNRMAAEAPPLSMKKVDGAWKIDGDALLPSITEKQLNEQTAVLETAIKQITDTAEDVTAGHFRSPDEIVILMNARVQKAVRAAQAKLAPMDDAGMGGPGGPAGPTGPTGPTPMPAK
ncbi:MAG: hypothetical protein JWM57_2348 [Phycisphaerales bacterium]|nr:hypothetical protein [Phycisphaerales bacterium]